MPTRLKKSMSPKKIEVMEMAREKPLLSRFATAGEIRIATTRDKSVGVENEGARIKIPIMLPIAPVRQKSFKRSLLKRRSGCFLKVRAFLMSPSESRNLVCGFKEAFAENS